MNDGFLRVAAATPMTRISDCRYNTDRIIEMIKQAVKKDVALIVFPELCITSYTCGDLFLHDSLLSNAMDGLMRICDETKEDDIIAMVGLPLQYGSLLYNCAAVVYHGDILGIVPKTNIPNYSEFYEKRYFSSGYDLGHMRINGKSIPFGNKLIFRCSDMLEFRFSIEICEDLWSVIPQSCYLARDGANIIANLSASNEFAGKAAYRRDLVRVQSSRIVCDYIYASSGKGESTTDVVFSGHNIISENGKILAESQRFKSEMIMSDLDLGIIEAERRRLTGFPPCEEANVVWFDFKPKKIKLIRKYGASPFIPEKREEMNEICKEIISIQSAGLEGRLSHTKSKKVVLGISGGLDSSLALLVCARTFDNMEMDRKNIIAVSMPSSLTSERTYKNARNIAQAYGVTFREIKIDKAVKQHFEDINHSESEKDIVYENVQARERTQILMDIANKEHGIVVGTGDLSELALGWTTYNGDHISMYGVNSSVPKTLVRHLIGYEAMRQLIGIKNILDDIINTPISPELIPPKDGKFQLTEDVVGPYELVDFFLFYFLRYGFSPKKIFRIACEAFKGKYKPLIIKKNLYTFFERFFKNQFKRSCMPDSPKVIGISLSPRGDFRMPSDASAEEWLREVDILEV